MKILHVVPTFYPATYWGGPIWSTKAICDGIALQDGVELRVLTSDAAGPDVEDRVTPVQLPYPVTYTRRVAGNCASLEFLARMPKAIAWADIVHVTGTYNMPTLPAFVLARAMSKPVVWSPRGALLATADWADAPKIRLKHGFERLAQVLRPRETVLHVTAVREAEGSVARLRGIEPVIIRNSVDVPDIAPRPPREGAACRLMFLSRLHQKKGLELLFDAMERLPQNFTLDVYGAGDRDYAHKVEQRAAGMAGRVKLHGHVEGAAKADAFAKADLFVLPSYSENFGIVVAEALAHGVPVLTTQATPWQGINHEGCGRCIDLSQCDLVEEIKKLAAGDLQQMGQKGRAWVRRDFSVPVMVDGFSRLYRSLLSPKKPEAIA